MGLFVCTKFSFSYYRFLVLKNTRLLPLPRAEDVGAGVFQKICRPLLALSPQESPPLLVVLPYYQDGLGVIEAQGYVDGP